jgi:hypothetical protein
MKSAVSHRLFFAKKLIINVENPLHIACFFHDVIKVFLFKTVDVSSVNFIDIARNARRRYCLQREKDGHVEIRKSRDHKVLL